MSIESMAIVLNHSRSTGTAKVVILGIASHDGDGGAWPSVATLARYANVEVRNVQRALKRLEELREIRIYVQDGGTSRTPDHTRPNRYEITLRCPPTCDGTSQHRTTRPPASDPLAETSPGGDIATPPLAETSPEPSLNHPSMETSTSNEDFQHVRDRFETSNTPQDRSGAKNSAPSYAGWNSGQKIAQAAKQVRASSKVKRPDLSKPLNPIGKVPPAPEYPRFEPDPPRQPPEPRTPEQEAAVQHASQLVCPEGFGNRPSTRQHWFPGTLTGCARCGTDAADITRPALTELERTA